MLDKLFRGAVIVLAMIGCLYIADITYAGISGDAGYLYSLFITTELEIGSSGTLDMDGTLDIDGSFDLGATNTGTGTFTTTAENDTVLITGALAADAYLLTNEATAADPQDVLNYTAKVGTLIVIRPANGASGLTYTWVRIE